MPFGNFSGSHSSGLPIDFSKNKACSWELNESRFKILFHQILPTPRLLFVYPKAQKFIEANLFPAQGVIPGG